MTRAKLKDAFKLQVYTSLKDVKKIDRICKKLNCYRSTFVAEAIRTLMETPKYQKLLGK